MPYIHFTEEQKARAAAVDLEEFLRYQGEKFTRSGHDLRMNSDHSVTIRGNRWYDHADRKGGGPISFVQNYYGKSYPEAVTMLLGGEQGTVYPATKPSVEEPPKPFELPPKNRDMCRVYAYLNKSRKIDQAVISYFARAGTLYEDAEYHNCVFIGTDENGIPRHVHKRSTNSFGKAFRINVEGGDPGYSFHHMGEGDRLFVFEAPIDMLSYISMHPQNWQTQSYVSCCGTSFMPVKKALERLPQTGHVFLCLDNDEAGHKASQRMADALTELGIPSMRLSPKMKDWNEDLVQLQMPTQEVIHLCQVFGY